MEKITTVKILLTRAELLRMLELPGEGTVWLLSNELEPKEPIEKDDVIEVEVTTREQIGGDDDF